MTSAKILRVRRADEPNEFILIKATKTGKTDIDVDLLATEGASPYVGKVRERKLKDLQSKSYQGDDEEFKTILKYVLDGGDALPKVRTTRDLEIVAEIHGEDPHQKITIVFRKRIEQITQRLGSIELKQKDDEEVGLFDWTGLAVLAGRERTIQVADLTAKYAAAQETIQTLESKFEQLVKAKEEQEQLMLSQFAALLNAKKMKIRDQQRILATAEYDKQTLQGIQNAAESKDHKPISSRKGKRKATETIDEDDESDDFNNVEGGDVRDRGDFQADTESDRGSTPDPETATEDEAEADEEPDEGPLESPPTKVKKPQRSNRQSSKTTPAPPTQNSQRTTRKSSSNAPPSQTSDNSQRTTRQTAAKGTESSSPPPRRDLPFARRQQKEKNEPKSKTERDGPDKIANGSPVPAAHQDEDTASDDDEL